MENQVIILNHKRRDALEQKQAGYERRLKQAVRQRSQIVIDDTNLKLGVLKSLLRKPPGEDVTVNSVLVAEELLESRIVERVDLLSLKVAFASIDAVNSGDTSGVERVFISAETPKPVNTQTAGSSNASSLIESETKDSPPEPIPLESPTRTLFPAGQSFPPPERIISVPRKPFVSPPKTSQAIPSKSDESLVAKLIGFFRRKS